MRTTIQWTADYEPQIGDRVMLSDGPHEMQGGTLANSYYNRCQDMKRFARAIGSISRLVPEPKPPEGYRLATEEDRNGPKEPDTWAMYWNDILNGWIPSHSRCWVTGLCYAVPLPDPNSTSGVCTLVELLQKGFPMATELIWALKSEAVEGEVFMNQVPYVQLPDTCSDGDKVWVITRA